MRSIAPLVLLGGFVAVVIAVPTVSLSSIASFDRRSLVWGRDTSFNYHSNCAFQPTLSVPQGVRALFEISLLASLHLCSQEQQLVRRDRIPNPKVIAGCDNCGPTDQCINERCSKKCSDVLFACGSSDVCTQVKNRNKVSLGGHCLPRTLVCCRDSTTNFTFPKASWGQCVGVKC